MVNKTSISIPNAVAQLLSEQPNLVVSRYQLAAIIWDLYKANAYDGTALRSHKPVLDYPAFARFESKLLQNGVLRSIPSIAEKSAYVLLGTSIADPRILACEIDPFCYLSHLSAMEFHGLTDRLPEMLYLSSPGPSQWKVFANEKMAKELGESFSEYRSTKLPVLNRIGFDKLLGRSVHRFTSSHLGAFRSFKDQRLRVATLGRTFLDMLREPALCGGIGHVLQVFKEHAQVNLRLIIDELDQHGSAIDKVRAGFLLEEVCHLNDARIDAWTVNASRGGSRKLDAAVEYSPRFSERWCLSINVPIPTE